MRCPLLGFVAKRCVQQSVCTDSADPRSVRPVRFHLHLPFTYTQSFRRSESTALKTRKEDDRNEGQLHSRFGRGPVGELCRVQL